MTDQEILDQFEELVDDTLSQTLEIQLANLVKNKIERELKLEIIKALDSSLTTSVGQTYATAMALPSAFRGLATDRIYLGADPCFPVPFDRSVQHRSTGGRFYIDLANSTLHLCGTQGSAQTVTIPYLKKTTDITEASLTAETTTIVWPTEFHSLISFEMVKMFDAIERGDRNRSWRPEWDIEHRLVKQALMDWDHDLKLAAIGNSTPYSQETAQDGEYQINLP